MPKGDVSVFSPVLFERIAEIGFLATEVGLSTQAEQIFSGLVQAKPGKPYPLIGLAIAHARAGSSVQAIEELKDVVRQFPDNETAKSALGAMLIQAKEPGALKLFEEVLATRSNAAAVNVALVWIDQARELEKGSGEKKGRGSDSGSLEFFRHHNIRI